MENPDLKEASKQDSMNPNRKILLICSGILWLASLVMVGFYNQSGQSIWGWEILPQMLMAWFSIFLIMPNKYHLVFEILPFLAVYANLFYLIAWLLLWISRANMQKSYNIFVVPMLVLASLTCFLEDAQHMGSVAAWGYGAFVWACSLILLAGAAWDKRVYHSRIKSLKPYLVGFAFVLFGLKSYQIIQIKILEKEAIKRLNGEIAKILPNYIMPMIPTAELYTKLYTRIPSSYILEPIEIKPPAIVLKENELVEIKAQLINLNLFINRTEVKLPKQFWYEGQFIYFFSDKPPKPGPPPTYQFIVQKNNDIETTLSIYNMKEKREIWRQTVWYYNNRTYPAINTDFLQQLFLSPENKQP